MRAILLFSVLITFTLGLAVTPTASAIPDPVETYSCFAGGSTIVVLGRTVATCFLGPGGSPVGYTFCENDGRQYWILGVGTRCV